MYFYRLHCSVFKSSFSSIESQPTERATVIRFQLYVFSCHGGWRFTKDPRAMQISCLLFCLAGAIGCESPSELGPSFACNLLILGPNKDENPTYNYNPGGAEGVSIFQIRTLGWCSGSKLWTV